LGVVRPKADAIIKRSGGRSSCLRGGERLYNYFEFSESVKMLDFDWLIFN